MSERFNLNLVSAPYKATRKKHERGYFAAPFCDDCAAIGLTTRRKDCKACMALYQRAWRDANPERAAEISRRTHDRRRAQSPEKPKPKKLSFKQRYRSDVEFRDHHKAKSRAWDAAHPEYVARKTMEQGERRKANYKTKKHPPIVYFIRSYLTGLIKIGTTTNLAVRIVAFRNSHPGRLEVLGVADGGQPLEAEIHRLFDGSRYDGEWFTETPALLDYIKTNTRDQHPDIGGVSLAPLGAPDRRV